MSDGICKQFTAINIWSDIMDNAINTSANKASIVSVKSKEIKANVLALKDDEIQQQFIKVILLWNWIITSANIPYNIIYYCYNDIVIVKAYQITSEYKKKLVSDDILKDIDFINSIVGWLIGENKLSSSNMVQLNDIAKKYKKRKVILSNGNQVDNSGNGQRL